MSECLGNAFLLLRNYFNNHLLVLLRTHPNYHLFFLQQLFQDSIYLLVPSIPRDNDNQCSIFR